MRHSIIIMTLLRNDKVKVIPYNIDQLLTPIGLAYWFMDDGYAERSGFILCTYSFTESEIDL